MNTAQLYNSLSPFYFLIDLFCKGHKKHLIKAVNAAPKGVILEVGVGHGTHLKFYNARSITAIDISKKMLDQAKKNNPTDISFLQMDVLDLHQIKESYDTIVLSHVLSTSRDENAIIDSCYSSLTPKGRLIILNHFTENKTLGFFERMAQPISRIFHFKSHFPLKNLTALKSFKKKKALKFGFQNSFQLIVFEKS